MDFDINNIDDQITIDQNELNSNKENQMVIDKDFAQWLNEKFAENPTTTLTTITTCDTINLSVDNNTNNSCSTFMDEVYDILQISNSVNENINFNQNENSQSLNNFIDEPIIHDDDDLSSECSNDISMMPDQDGQIDNLGVLTQYNNNNNNLSLLPSLLPSSITNDSNQSTHAAMTTSSPDSSVNQTDTITDSDKSFTIYGDLDRPTIAKLCEFNVEKPPVSSRRQPIRLNTKSMAIISWTNVSKDVIMNYIKKEFRNNKIQYICIGEEINELNQQKQLCIQIIFEKKINKKTRFLDNITRTCCNYQVTHNILAWNDYVKKDLNCHEFGEFPSELRGYKQYPSLEVIEKQNTTRNKAAKAKATKTKTTTTRKTTAACCSN